MSVINNLRSGFILPSGEIVISPKDNHAETIYSLYKKSIGENEYTEEMSKEFFYHPDIETSIKTAFESFMIQCLGFIKVGSPTDHFYYISINYPKISKDSNNKITYNFIQQTLARYRASRGDYRDNGSDRIVYSLCSCPYYGDLIGYDENKGYPLCRKR